MYVKEKEYQVMDNKNCALTKITNPNTLLYHLDEDNFHPNSCILLKQTCIKNVKCFLPCFFYVRGGMGG
jgi:hypothetical protein